MKVTFVNPLLLSFEKAYDSRAGSQPMGILYMATVLENNGIGVNVVDQPGEKISDEALIKKIKRIDPDIVGFSTLVSTGIRAAKQAHYLKKWNPNLPIVFGGYYATMNAERILQKYPQVDYIIKGEGEYSMLSLAQAMESGGNLKSVGGLVYRENKRVKYGKKEEMILDLDDLPIPRRKFVKGNDYGYISGAKMPKFTSILSSRGCPFACTYCCCAAFAHRRWRPRGVENVVDEIEQVISEGYENVLFIDDNFTINKKRVIKICNLIRKRNLEFNWIAEGRVDSASREMFQSMVSAGFKILYIGIESANQRVLDYYNKGTKVNQAVAAVNNARKAGTDIITGTFIVGAPTETVSEIYNTINFAMKLDLDFPQFNILSAIPGAKIHEELVKSGYINQETGWEDAVDVPEVHPNCVPEKRIAEIIAEGYQRFIKRPGWAARELIRTIRSGYRMKLVSTNIRVGRRLYDQLVGSFSGKPTTQIT
ncbi:MAG: B12-binding domain-containing radical SAM protein [Promethearchaeota archaeon]